MYQNKVTGSLAAIHRPDNSATTVKWSIASTVIVLSVVLANKDLLEAAKSVKAGGTSFCTSYNNSIIILRAHKRNPKLTFLGHITICSHSMYIDECMYRGSGHLNTDRRQRKRYLKILLHFICFTSRLFQLIQLVQKQQTSQESNWRRVRVKKENEEFIVVCSRSPQNLEFGHFTLLFCRGRQRNVQNSKRTCRAIGFLH